MSNLFNLLKEKKYDNNFQIYISFFYLKELSRVTGEGNGNPLQYSCLENPMDGGAW